MFGFTSISSLLLLCFVSQGFDPGGFIRFGQWRKLAGNWKQRSQVVRVLFPCTLTWYKIYGTGHASSCGTTLPFSFSSVVSFSLGIPGSWVLIIPYAFFPQKTQGVMVTAIANLKVLLSPHLISHLFQHLCNLSLYLKSPLNYLSKALFSLLTLADLGYDHAEVPTARVG